MAAIPSAALRDAAMTKVHFRPGRVVGRPWWQDGLVRCSQVSIMTSSVSFPGSGGGGFGEPPQDRPIEHQLICSLEELYTGTTKRIRIQRSTASGPETELLTVEVPPGWKAGTKVTFAQKGERTCAPGMSACRSRQCKDDQGSACISVDAQSGLHSAEAVSCSGCLQSWLDSSLRLTVPMQCVRIDSD